MNNKTISFLFYQKSVFFKIGVVENIRSRNDCERRHVTKAGDVGYKIKKEADKGYSNNEWTIFSEIKT